MAAVVARQTSPRPSVLLGASAPALRHRHGDRTYAVDSIAVVDCHMGLQEIVRWKECCAGIWGLSGEWAVVEMQQSRSRGSAMLEVDEDRCLAKAVAVFVVIEAVRVGASRRAG